MPLALNHSMLIVPSERASRAALLKNRRLLIFASCAALFQLANTSMMPLLSGTLAYEGKSHAAPLIAVLIVVPQVLVGLLALGSDGSRKTWSQAGVARRVRRPPIRAVIFVLVSNPLALMIVQLLHVITGAVLGVMTALVSADVTKGTGRFNLAQGMFGTVMGVGAVLSPTLTGLTVDQFGRSAGFAILASEGLVALLILAVFLPETKEELSNSAIELRQSS